MASSTVTVLTAVRKLLTSGEAVAGTEVKLPERVLDALAQLEQVAVDEAVLTQTKIAFAVKDLQRADHPAVANAAKAVLRKWKTLLTAARPATPAAGSSPAGTPAPAPAPAPATAAAAAATSPAPAAKAPATQARTPSQSAVDTKALVRVLEQQYGGNLKRQKPAELLATALMTGEQAAEDLELVADVASRIEKELFNRAKGSTDDAEYKDKTRSLVSNFRQNLKLRALVIAEKIGAGQLCAMTALELASDEKRKEMEALHREIVSDSMEAKVSEAVTDMFQCGKCKKRRTTYRQAQTRSADEPMTTFVTCMECGNRWKFS